MFDTAERSILVGIGNSGSQIGNAIALPLGSFLCLHGYIFLNFLLNFIHKKNLLFFFY
jgi:hypothetical protein